MSAIYDNESGRFLHTDTKGFETNDIVTETETDTDTDTDKRKFSFT
jgi:hypothetical protein